MNHLFPIFLRNEVIRILIIGGGSIALEKLQVILKQQPSSHILLVAKEISPEIQTVAHNTPSVILRKKTFSVRDLNQVQIVLAATRNRILNEQVVKESRRKNILANAADMPDLCDFYLGSIVQKGNLKIGISTNGKSPIAAKRIREFLDDSLPDEIDELIRNLHQIRNNLKGNFREKVEILNELTKDFSYLNEISVACKGQVWD